jgi:glycosyltransferase involved in cell wall biosynthesis
MCNPANYLIKDPFSRRKRLAVVPSDPLSAYIDKGNSELLREYFNPTGYFDEIYCLSPLEKEEFCAFGMHVIPTATDQFAKRLKALRVDVVRAYGGYWPSDLACRERVPGIPVVVSIHDTKNVHRSVRYADIVICMSKVVQDLVLQLGTSKERTRLMPNRIDTTVFRPQPDCIDSAAMFERFPPGRHILHIGRRSEQKNLDTVIRAVSHLPSDYSCVFVGQGDRTGYVALTEKLGVAERCYWIDSVSNSELPFWYSWCDCFCVPSRWEGFGLVFIEAAACGAAIVTSDTAPMNEYLVHDGSASLVAEYEDPARIAEAVRKVCEDADYRKRITAGAVEAAQPFARERIDLIEVAIYHEAMGIGRLPMRRRAEIEVWRRWLDLREGFAGIQGSVERSIMKLRSGARGLLRRRWLDRT